MAKIEACHALGLENWQPKVTEDITEGIEEYEGFTCFVVKPSLSMVSFRFENMTGIARINSKHTCGLRGKSGLTFYELDKTFENHNLKTSATYDRLPFCHDRG